MIINGMDDLPADGGTSVQDDPAAPSAGRPVGGRAVSARTSATASPSAREFESFDPDRAEQTRTPTNDAHRGRS